jgi:flagellar biosynthesis/type III secretory pathway chaperone
MYKKPGVSSYSSLSADSNQDYNEFFTGYTISPGQLGTTTSPQTANQVAEVTARLNEGMSVIELQPIGQGVMEGIPKQQFKEVNQLARLTGSEMTLHAPVIDLSGFTQQGWSETTRQEAERHLKGIIDRGYELNPQGNVPITIHASPGIQAKEWTSSETGPKPSMITVVYKETGQPVPIQDVEKYLPGEGKRKWSPETAVRELNEDRWEKQLMGLEYYKRIADQEMHAVKQFTNTESQLGQDYGILKEKERSGETLTEQEQKRKQMFEKARENAMKEAYTHLKYINNEIKDIYSAARRFDPKNKDALDKSSEQYTEFADEMKKGVGKSFSGEKMAGLLEMGHKATSDMIDVLHESKPQLFEPVEDFARKYSAETLGNAALHGYKEFKDHAPILSLENVFPDWTFSRADELKKLVEESRDKFVEKAVDGKVMKEDDARKMANKLIGVTWDIAHINLLRKYGYTEEQIKEETKKIAPYVKHVHITDNFGFEDSHLPTGMGNVPTDKLIKEMKSQGFKGKIISEAGGQFVQQFRSSPNPYVLEAIGSPIYSGGSPGTRHGSYFSGYGPIFPEQHFSMYGGGFASLPQELGGQIPGKQSRLSGTPID